MEYYDLDVIFANGEILVYQVQVVTELFDIESQITKVFKGEGRVAVRSFEVEAQGFQRGNVHIANQLDKE